MFAAKIRISCVLKNAWHFCGAECVERRRAKCVALSLGLKMPEGRRARKLELSENEREELRQLLTNGSPLQRLWAEVLLEYEGNENRRAVARIVGCTASNVSKVLTQFRKRGVRSVREARRGRKRILSDEEAEQLLRNSRRDPPTGISRVTHELLSQQHEVSRWTISRELQRRR